ncbi:MAG: alkaline phosphatase family protein [Cyclobacteriaceae bacterium]
MKTLLSALFVLIISQAFTQPLASKPKLVVGIVVDQMKAEYLYRFGDLYGADGFNLLKEKGFVYKNAHFNYMPTKTGPGHASIYTGTTPSRHGIIGNDWYNKYLNDDVYCAGDQNATAIGGSGKGGNISAKNIQVTTITDELRMFTNNQSKVIGLSLKDRGAALPAGHNPTGAYWFDNTSCEFISSSYYTNQLPKWVDDFNKKDFPAQYMEQSWTLSLPVEKYTASSPDNNPYERSLFGNDAPTFPYDLSKVEDKHQFRYSPYGNSIITELALAAIVGEKLGVDEYTDFLAISYSTTDHVGHDFGPRSIEVQDTYLKLDKEFARLIKYLDANFGRDEYVVFLTADHAVADVPAFLEDLQYPGGRFDKSGADKIMASMKAKYGEGEWILNVSNDQIYLNHDLINQKGLSLYDFQDFLSLELIKLPYIAEALPAYILAHRSANDPIVVRAQNGYNSELSGDVIIINKSGMLSEYRANKGTNHHSPYTYDTHVPIIFFGGNIPMGKSVREVSVTDIAPSISMLLDISLPSASTGKPLIELFE